MDSCVTSLVLSMPIWFKCCCFSTPSCSTACIDILLSYIAILSMIVISSLNDQYGGRSFCHGVWVLTVCLCSLSSVAIPISSGVMQYGISVHDSITLMVMHMPGFLHLCMSHGCVWIASLWWVAVAKACIVLLYYIDAFLIVFSEACVIGLQHFLEDCYQ